jgi:hypothetical protein
VQLDFDRNARSEPLAREDAAGGHASALCSPSHARIQTDVILAAIGGSAPARWLSTPGIFP